MEGSIYLLLQILDHYNKILTCIRTLLIQTNIFENSKTWDFSEKKIFFLSFKGKRKKKLQGDLFYWMKWQLVYTNSHANEVNLNV